MLNFNPPQTQKACWLIRRLCIWLLWPLPGGRKGHKAFKVCSQVASCHRIGALLGQPSLKDWPELASLHHWQDNTEDVRDRLSRSAVGPSHLSHYVQTAA